MTQYLSIDPGVTTGWALMEDGSPVEMGTVPFEEVFDFINQPRWNSIYLYVVERYIIRPAKVMKGYAHQWNKGEALQIIGAVKFVAAAKGAEVVEQDASDLPMAARRLNFPYDPNKHVNDMHSAVLHGSFYWFKEHGPNAQDEAYGSSEEGDGTRVSRPSRVTQISSWQGLRAKRGKASLEVPEQDL